MLKLTFILAAVLSLSSIDIYLARVGLIPGASLIGISLSLMALFMMLKMSSWRFAFNIELAQTRVAISILTMLMLWGFIGSLYNPSPLDGFIASTRSTIYIINSIIICFIAQATFGNRWMLQATEVAIVIVCGSVIINPLFPELFPTSTARPAGILINPNASAQTAACLFSIYIMLKPSNNKKTYIAFTLSVSAAALTLSRSGIILCAVSTAFWLFGQHHSKSKPGTYQILLILISLAAAPFIATHLISSENATLTNRVAQLSEAQSFTDMNDPRVQLAKKYLNLWTDSPLIGHGTNFTSGDFDQLEGATHNIYVKILAENGVIGLSIYIALFLCGTTSAIINNRKSILAAWSILFAWGFFANTLFDNRAFWIFLLITAISSTPAKFKPTAIKPRHPALNQPLNFSTNNLKDRRPVTNRR